MTLMAGGGFARVTLVLSLALASSVSGSVAEFGGQASGWLGFSLMPTGDTMRNRVPTLPAGLRYIPTLEAAWSSLDAEASVNACASGKAYDHDSVVLAGYLKPYRLWARLSTERFEARAGLQKIDFGSATLLRPLQWFDRIDPRDPLGMTDGVYGLLGRYYFQNNVNLWAWGLLGNSSLKGWEHLGSERWRPEFGGRAQLPVPRGEVAATYHRRRTGDTAFYPFPAQVQMDEDRLGIDGKWDIGVGLWFEGTAMKQGIHTFADSDWWQWSTSLGLDYTLGIGSGLTVLAEHMVVGSFVEGFESDEGLQLSALMLSCPLGLVDNLRGIVLFDWRGKGIYNYLAWQRTLDKWLFTVAAFWNPDTPASFGAPGGGAAGKGVQLMVVYNH